MSAPAADARRNPDSVPAADARRTPDSAPNADAEAAAGPHLLATRRGLARVCGDGTAELLDLPYRDVAELLRAGAGLAPAAAAPARDRLPLDTITAELVAPLGSTRAVWGVGLNYHCKARVAGRAAPTEPVLYLKSASAGSGPDATVALPDSVSAQPDYEGEIALVIGARMHRTPAEQAWSHVAAITAANDLTARDVMAASANPTLAKSFPGYGALGASVLDIAAVADRDAIPVRTTVNGEVRQDATSADLIFPVPQLLAWITRYVILEPGDVVLTGTPAGTGQDRGCFLRPGDLVEVSVGGVLPLRTRFRAESSADQPDGRSHAVPPSAPSHRKSADR
ncbi:fumarylacetoacetate hydrolase family protein [Solwaraspora sp. WMMD406]|uniref:fumarylacetoacetate hydrolase family protein n=1 Tax=Solwaraspora sp. WMMD406 TaxID=3016095 RepID=UPI002416F53E|nr:fumarylacetoacetate hydrolase family protein [Solwaraspora sp. WMMD406]MDG4764684.1 fumarylacetoacetate hydrolase family protein [Solwaraspora sp. WMMD406]